MGLMRETWVKDYLREERGNDAGMFPQSPALFLLADTVVQSSGRLTPAIINRLWNDLCASARVKGRIPHSARHAMGVHLVKKTGNPRTAQRQLGHKNNRLFPPLRPGSPMLSWGSGGRAVRRRAPVHVALLNAISYGSVFEAGFDELVRALGGEGLSTITGMDRSSARHAAAGCAASSPTPSVRSRIRLLPK
jgi:integrase-like protein